MDSQNVKAAVRLPYTSRLPLLLRVTQLAIWAAAGVLFATFGWEAWVESTWVFRGALIFVCLLVPIAIADALFRRTIFFEGKIIHVNLLNSSKAYSYSSVVGMTTDSDLMFRGLIRLRMHDGSIIKLYRGEYDRARVIAILREKCPEVRILVG